MKKTKIFFGILVIFILVSGWQIWKSSQKIGEELFVASEKTEYETGEILKIKIENKFRKNICFSSCYPYLMEEKGKEWESYPYQECEDRNRAERCIKSGKVKAFEIDLSSAREGLNRIAIPVCIDCREGDDFKESKTVYSNEFTIKEKQEVTITNDKTEYEQGENIKITVKNNLDKKMRIGSPPYSIEKFDNGVWIEIKTVFCPCEALCKLGASIVQPNGITEYQWNQKESWCSDPKRISTTISNQVDPGIYRIKTQISNEDGSNRKTIYSNEFTIK